MPAAPKSPQYKQHPSALGGGLLLLNANAFIAKDVSPAADVFLFGPPPASDVDSNGGSVARLLSVLHTFLYGRVTNTAGLLATDTVQLVYKAEGGREVILSEQAGAEAQGEKFLNNIDPTFVMAPTDLGVFVRIAQTVPDPDTRVDILIQSYDVRGVRLLDEDVTAVETPIPAGGGNPNLAQLVYENTTEDTVDVSLVGEEGFFYGCIHNYDDIPHTYQLFVSDGTTTMEISATDTPPTIPANRTESLVLQALPPGWSVRMSIGEAVSTFAPRFIMSPITVNFDVARTDQAGAY